MPVLGTVAGHEQDPGAGQVVDQGIEEDLRLRVDPVQVLEDKDHGLGVALVKEDALDGVERAGAPLGRIGRTPFGIVDGDVQQSQQGGQGGLQRPVQGEELPGHRLRDAPVGVVAGKLEVPEMEMDTNSGEASRRFERSIGILRAIGARNELARAYAAYARLLQREGEGLRARECRQTALEIFERLGTLGETDRLRALLVE